MIEKKKIIDAYNFRHACKVFDESKKISDEDFAFILETGRLSPSSFGYEPWKFLVVQNMQLRNSLKPATWGAQNTLPTASHFVVILARRQKEMRYDSRYIEHMMHDIHHLRDDAATMRREVYRRFQEKDFNLLESERATFEWACRQTYIALGNMMTSAAMIGVDSCPIEGFNANEVETIMEKNFNIDTDAFGVACMVAFGYRVDKPREKTRQNIDDITLWYK